MNEGDVLIRNCQTSNTYIEIGIIRRMNGQLKFREKQKHTNIIIVFTLYNIIINCSYEEKDEINRLLPTDCLYLMRDN